MITRHQIPKSLPVALLAAFIAATSALHATAVQTPLPVPMPDFMTPAQLAKWRADTTAKTVAAENAQAAQASASTPQSFYTGKPYLAESGSYAFKYREYNPEMNRWTTVDPSGFPDGANNQLYVKNDSLSYVDPDGKNAVLVLVGVIIISAAIINYANSISDAMNASNISAQYTALAQKAIQNGNGALADQLTTDAQQATGTALTASAQAALAAPGTLATGPAGVPESYEEALLVNGNYIFDIYALEE